MEILILHPRYIDNGKAVDISIKHSKEAFEKGIFIVDGKSTKANHLDIEFIKRDIGTGYHCKEGIYIGLGKKSFNLFKSSNYKEIDTREFFNKIIEFFNIRN